MTQETHKKYIKKQKQSLDEKDEIAKEILSAINFQALLFGTREQKSAMRKKIILTAIQQTDSLLTENSRIGREFAKEKISEYGS